MLGKIWVTSGIWILWMAYYVKMHYRLSFIPVWLLTLVTWVCEIIFFVGALVLVWL